MRGSSGGSIGNIRRRSSVTLSPAEITVSRAFGADMSTLTYELHRYNPDDKLWAINRAIETAFVDLFLPLRDESIKSDELLTNWDFETFSGGAFTGWSSKGTPTIAQETTRVFQGASSAKITASGGVEGLEQNLYTSVNQADISGKSIYVEGRAWTDTADSARIRISFDGTTFTNSSFHAGNEEFELLQLTAGIPVNATEMMVSIEVADTVVAYFDNMHTRIGRIYRHNFPSSLDRLFRVSAQSSQSDPNGIYVPVDGKPPAGRILRLEGKGVLSTVASDTDTVEIDGRHVTLLIYKAAEFFWERRFGQTQNESDEKQMNRAIDNYERLKGSTHSMPIVAQERQGWHVDETSSGKVLVFDY